jgi:uncharacterized protein (DUF302 family)
MTKRTVIALCAVLGASAAAAQDHVSVEADGSVAEVADRLAAAAEGAGATVFARIDHAAGAASVDMPIPDAELVVFGNPKLGTPAIAADPRAGLVLPLRVLVHEQEGQTVLTYESVDSMFAGLDIPPDAGFRGAMAGALERLTQAASAP